MALVFLYTAAGKAMRLPYPPRTNSSLLQGGGVPSALVNGPMNDFSLCLHYLIVCKFFLIVSFDISNFSFLQKLSRFFLSTHRSVFCTVCECF